MDEVKYDIKLGDLVSYVAQPIGIQIFDPLTGMITNPPEYTRQLWLVVRVTDSQYTLMQYHGVGDIRDWHQRDSKMQDAWKMSVRKELFQTQLMQAELHDWFLNQKEVGSAG